MIRGSAAVAAGTTTWGRLRGPHFRRLFPDVYAPAGDEPPSLALRSRAAAVLVGDRGVLSGYSAAELLGAACAPVDAPAEVTVLRGRQRAHPGLLVHRDRVAPGELCRVDDVWTTGPMRTAYDLVRRLDVVEGTVAVDALANAHRFPPDMLLNFAVHYPRARGNTRVAEVLALADARAGSPMETRLRLVLRRAGLPRPEVQWVVQDERARRAVWLDLAYPAHRIGIEYEGEVHARPEQVLRDAGRYTRLVDAGWRIYRYTKYDVLGDPVGVVAQIRRALAAGERNGIVVRRGCGNDSVPLTRDRG